MLLALDSIVIVGGGVGDCGGRSVGDCGGGGGTYGCGLLSIIAKYSLQKPKITF